MTFDRHAKFELTLRAAFRNFWLDKLSSPKQKVLVIPGFEIPRGGNVDLLLAPQSGTILCLLQRSDYVAAYKHTVGQMIGILVHYHQMKDREVREALRTSQAHPDVEELKQTSIDVLRVSKRLLEDRQSGEITLALYTELPEVPQQARELEANFCPIGFLLETWLPSPIKKKRLCQSVEFYTVNTNVDPPKVVMLNEAIKPLLKMGA